MINDIGFLQVKGVIFHSTVLKWWWRWDLSRMAMKMVMMMWSYCRQLPQVVILYFLRWHLIWWFLQWFEIGWQWRRWWSYCRQSWRDFRLDYTKFLGLQWPQLSMSWRLGEDCISSSPRPSSTITTPITSINIVVQQPYHKVLVRHMEAGHLFLAWQVHFSFRPLFRGQYLFAVGIVLSDSCFDYSASFRC